VTHPLNETRSKAEERAVERLRRICLALPGVSEKIAWGEPTWRVGKIFAQMSQGLGRSAHRRTARLEGDCERRS
jgi:hypothetical protein